MSQICDFFAAILRRRPARTKRARKKTARLKLIQKELAAIQRGVVPAVGAEPYILMATFRSTIGLGHSARRLAFALRQAGHRVHTIDVTEIFGLDPIVPWTDEPPPAGTAGTLVLCVQPPTLFRILRARGTQDFIGRRWVGYWFWELEWLPESWRWVAAQMDEFWCSSRFVFDCFARSVPGRTARYVPLVIEPPVPSEKRLVDFGLPEPRFTVLSVFDLRSSIARKNPEGMIDAFRQAFGSRDDVQYVLKVAGADKFPGDLARLESLAAKSQNIRILSHSLPIADLYALIQRSQLYLSLHRSEGLGMVPAEAALLGTPVVATGWSGVLDFLDHSCAALVNYSFVPIDHFDNLPTPAGSLWAEPDIADAVRWLRTLETNDDLRMRLAQRAREKACRVFGQENFNEIFG